MNFTGGNLYHIYNRGNNQQTIFFEDRHYKYFIRLVKQFIKPRCEIIAWCLMPNHFHFLIYATPVSAERLPNTIIPIQQLSEGFRLLLSSYCKAINKEQRRTGNLFQQKTKSKCVGSVDFNYSVTAFCYIHSNPCKAGLVKSMGEWKYSSFREYAKVSDILQMSDTSGDELCNLPFGAAMLEFDPQDFLGVFCGNVLSGDALDRIF